MRAGQGGAPRARARGSRGIALFGGSFDPVHSGHLAVAEAAVSQLGLAAVHFIPSARPPHKASIHLTPFVHRFAMVALACAGHPRFLPSLAEADSDGGPRLFYSIDTVRHFRRNVLRPGERLYFLIGADAFLQIPTWKSYRALLNSCDFIVAHRPGFPLAVLRRVIPPEMLRPRAPAKTKRVDLATTVVHLVPTVSSHISSTEIRQRLKAGERIRGLVPPLVQDYILRQGLYR